MPKRVTAPPALSTRYVALHAGFKPDGNPRDDLKPLMDLYIEVQTHLNRVRGREQRQKEREQHELRNAIDKRSPLVASALQGERDGDSISDNMLQMVPDEALRRKVFDWHAELDKQMSETPTTEELRNPKDVKRLKRYEKTLKTKD